MNDVSARRAIEALRSGVPSPAACREMGTSQTALLEEFCSSLDAVEIGEGSEPLVIEANFGDGKTHLLHVMKEIAQRRNFVTSYVVVGAGMPLGSPLAVLRSLCESAQAPEKIGKALLELYHTPRRGCLDELRAWARTAAIEDRFRAILHLLAESRDDEMRREILDHLEGNWIANSKLTKALREIQQASNYQLGKFTKTELADQRIELLAQFFKAFGTSGWVVFFDEVERMERFTFRQRLAAYEQLGWWRQICRRAGTRLHAVFAHTAGPLTQCLDEKGDRARIEGTGSSLIPGEGDLRAQDGIELLEGAQRLEETTPQDLEKIEHKLRDLYERAYGVKPRPQQARRDRTTTRSEIRRWITLWDLERHYPDYIADIQEDELARDTTEIEDGDLALDDD